MKQLERGLGKVLFIDEAYRLGQGPFAQEAIDELVDNITKPRFAGKLVIILAGYDDDMNNLLRVNEGLSSRFADEVSFPSLSPAHCFRLLENMLKQNQIGFPSIQDRTVYNKLLVPIAEMTKLPAWGNARDVQTLAKSIVRAVFRDNTTKSNQLLLPADTALNCIESMLAERYARAKLNPSTRSSFTGPMQSLDHLPSVPRIGSGTSTASKVTSPAFEDERTSTELEPLDTPDKGRDAGVSDSVWQQLQRDEKEAELQILRTVQDIQKQQEAYRLMEEAEKEAQTEVARLRDIQAKNKAEALEALRLREEARIREMEARAERERILRELERRKQQERERRMKEELAQSKLRQMGVCEAGYKWIKQGDGYRCAGGSHWVSNSQLDL